VVNQAKGTAAMVPIWIASGAPRDRVGHCLVLVVDELDDASVVLEAVPALEIGDAPAAAGFNPFGRGDARNWSIRTEDVRLLAGEPR
jgi:hypothetical protein